MTYYAPCMGCARKPTCPVLASAKAAIAGNAKLFGSVKVNCKKLYQTDFPKGSRIRVRSIRDGKGDMSMKAIRSLSGMSGTVFQWRTSGNGRAMILLDDEVYFDEDDGDSIMCGMQSVEHRDIELIEEPARQFCQDCEQMLDADGAPVIWYHSKAGKQGGCQSMGCAREPGYVPPPAPWVQS